MHGIVDLFISYDLVILMSFISIETSQLIKKFLPILHQKEFLTYRLSDFEVPGMHCILGVNIFP